MMTSPRTCYPCPVLRRCGGGALVPGDRRRELAGRSRGNAPVSRTIRRASRSADRASPRHDRAAGIRTLARTTSGAYAFVPDSNEHLILINLPRIDHSRPRSVEVVVAEELLHMRDRLDGDFRRHAKHGYDRIAHRVSALTGATLEEIRASLVPPQRRQARYLYLCPSCGVCVPRQQQGTWSCGRCAPRFDPQFILLLQSTAGT